MLWKTKKNKTRIINSLFVSIFLHLIASIYFVSNKITPDFSLKTAQETKNKPKLTKISLSDVKFISKKEIENIKKQMVQNSQNGRKVEDVKTRFEGESNQFYDRQTIARVVDKYKDAGKGESTTKTQKTQGPIVAETAKKSKSKIATPILSLSELGTISLNTAKDKEVEEVFKEMENHEKVGTLNGSQNAQGVAANNDFIEDIPLGDVTNLNTTENKYYGFYHRIRQKLEQYWGSTIHAQARRLYKSGRRMPASDNLITAVVVVLSDRGQIIDIKIEGSSGIRELDQAAVESFNKAGPFPNPPKGLLVGGRAVISWGFVVKS